VESAGILARTRVSLTRHGSTEPIWSEEFTLRNSALGTGSGESILFQSGAEPYWASFFVPVSSWNSAAALRQPHGFDKPVVNVETVGERALVLFEDGEFRIFDLGDPAQPLPLGSYQRPRDLTHWSGLRLTGSRVVLYGPDGIEIVELAATGATRVGGLDRSVVGSVIDVQSFGEALVVVSNRGMLLVEGEEPAASMLLERPTLGAARHQDQLLFTDGVSLYVSTIALLRQKRMLAELRIGKGFQPGRVRVYGDTALVIGARGILRVDVSNPSAPRLLSRIEMAEVGAVSDAALLAGRIFLLGERGLQVSDASGERVVDAVDVAARSRFGSAGRHMVAIGGTTLQVVDATPLVVSPAAAAPAR